MLGGGVQVPKYRIASARSALAGLTDPIMPCSPQQQYRGERWSLKEETRRGKDNHDLEEVRAGARSDNTGSDRSRSRLRVDLSELNREVSDKLPLVKNEVVESPVNVDTHHACRFVVSRSEIL